MVAIAEEQLRKEEEEKGVSEQLAPTVGIEGFSLNDSIFKCYFKS